MFKDAHLSLNEARPSRYLGLAAVVALILSAAPAAHASGLDLTVHPEVGAGISRYSIVPDGIWYQLGAQHSTLRTGRTWQVGIGGDIAHSDLGASRFGLAYHVAYVNLGHARSRCYCTTVDADYNTATRQFALPASKLPVALYSGNGIAQGIKVSLAPYVQFGKLRIGAEYGEFVYRPGWHETVYNWTATPNAGPYVTASIYTPPAHHYGREFGFFVTRGHFTLSYEHFHLPIRANESSVPPLFTGAQTVMLTYQF